jgi:predicted dinucleotide-binding enzyme
MRIGIIGGGNVGQALAGALRRAGHDPILLLRDPGPEDAPLAPLDGAAAYILAVPFGAAAEALAAVAPGSTPVLDATNPLAMSPDGLGLSLGFDDSGAERIARAIPGLRLAKIFNTTGANVMADAARFAPRPVMFAAGDDADAKAIALQLATDIGFEAIDAGPLRAARLLEAHAMLWIDLATRRGLGRDVAFALRRATAP